MPISKKGTEIFEQKPWLNDDPQTVDTLKENLDIEGGGSGLPEIGAGDDGKVLTANVSGDTKTATWETPSGGGGAFYIELTFGESSWTLNKTYSEIVSAFESGQALVVFSEEDGEYAFYSVNGIHYNIVTGYNVDILMYGETFDTYAFVSESENGVLTHTPL